MSIANLSTGKYLYQFASYGLVQLQKAELLNARNTSDEKRLKEGFCTGWLN